MLTAKELEMVNIFRKNLFRKENIRSIMKFVSKSSYGWTYNTVERLINLNILIHEKKGKSTLCSLNINSLSSIYYLSLLDYLEASNAKHIPYKNIIELINNIPVIYFSFIVTGSYAEGKQTKKSDIDICVIIEDDSDKKRVYNHLFNKGELMIPKVHPLVFTKSEFVQMLLDKEENYGKLLYKKRLIYFGAENYYLIVKEAIRNGFRG